MVNAAEAYRRQQIMTATPEALTLMLYNGCLKFMNEGDMIFVRDRAGELQSFRVYAAEKIGAADTAKLVRIAMQDENSLTLLTCEDELPDGGYASRRVVAARPAGK